MIYVDPSVIVEMLLGEKDAHELSNFLEVEASKNISIVILDSALLEAFVKINALPNKTFSSELLVDSILRFKRYHGGDSLNKNALIAISHLLNILPSATNIQLQIAANAIASEGEILCEQTLISACPAEQIKKRKISQRFASVKIKI